MSLKSLNQVLGNLENRYKLQEHKQFQRLLGGWVEVVGPVVAAQTAPLSIHQGVLKVATSSSAWAQNLVFERQRILEKLNALLSISLLDIRFSTAQWRNSKTLVIGAGLQEQDRLWQEHPSRLASRVEVVNRQADAATTSDPIQAYQVWAKQVRSRTQHLPLCPQCKCPTPSGELSRWGICAVCAAKQW
jgi:predicted nucleic acid-binding Zn ribbon protein